MDVEVQDFRQGSKKLLSDGDIRVLFEILYILIHTSATDRIYTFDIL